MRVLKVAAFSMMILSVSNKAYSYQAYWTDIMQRNFSDGAKVYDQTLYRVGGTASKANKALWGKIDQIQNKAYGPAQSIDGGALYRYGLTSTTLGLGLGNDFHLRSNRLYILEQRFYLQNEKVIPLIGVAREEYLGTPQSYYHFLRLGLGMVLAKDFFLSVQLQKIKNSFSDQTSSKLGFGSQVSILYQKEKWLGQVAVLKNCLGETQFCHGSRDSYDEYLANAQVKLMKDWALRINASYIKQSSRFVSPFSGTISNNNSTHSEIVGLGIMKIIP
jgi:hypothetical protein